MHVSIYAGVLRGRSSDGLLGMQPVIYSGESRAFKSAITLDTVKVATHRQRDGGLSRPWGICMLAQRCCQICCCIGCMLKQTIFA
jgi:hypothetical protein